MKRYLILVCTLMIMTPMIAMEEAAAAQQQQQQPQEQQQQPQEQQQQPNRTSDSENVFQKALESCCDSSCCAAIKYPVLTILYSPIFIINRICYPNGGRD